MSKRREKIQRERAQRKTSKHAAMMRADGSSSYSDKKRLQRKGVFVLASPLPRPELSEIASLGSVRNTE